MTDLDEIKSDPAVLGLYQSRVSLKREGKEFLGLCPLRPEKTPSFKVFQHQNSWVFKCFGCGVGGDIISLVAKVDGLNFKDAVDKIKHELGQSFSATKRSENVFSSLSGQTEKPAISYSLQEYSKLEKALAESKEGQEWLRSRGITYETAKRLHYGFKQDLGKLAASNPEIQSGGWISTAHIVGDRVLSIKYRSIIKKEFRKQPGMARGDETPLFNGETIEPLEPVYLTEGNEDAAVLEQAGFRASSIQSSSTPLTTANKEKLLQSDYIVLAGDNTPDGQDYMNKVWSEIQERTFKLSWPDGMKDANQTFLEHCKGDINKFRGLVEELTVKAKSQVVRGMSDLRESFKSQQRVNLEDSPFRWRWPWPGVDKMANIMPGAVVYLSSTNTGMSKTTLMMEASIFNALRGDVILNYSGELSNSEYAELVVSHLLKKDRHQLTTEDYQNKAYLLLAGIRYYIGCDNDLIKANDVLDLIEAGIRRSSAGVVIVDTVHYVCTHESDTIKAQENYMKRCKSMAQKYGVKWFNLGQPRKAQQNFKGKPIHVTDAKGSEMLISASDVAYAIHRDLAPVDDPNNPPKEPYKPLCQIFLQKGRSQGTGGAYTELFFNGDICTHFPITKEEPRESGLFTGGRE